MARRRGKTVDKWKQKTRYKILAPADYEHVELGTTLSSDAKNLAGRTLRVSMRDISGDKAKQHQNIVFELTKPDGSGVNTKFKKYLIARGYLRSIIRGETSKIDFVDELSVSGNKMRLKIVIITKGRSQSTQKKEIIKKISGLLKKHMNDTPENFVQLVVTERLGTELYNKIKNICPLRRLEIAEVSAI